jgi:hypothetical protein
VVLPRALPACARNAQQDSIKLVDTQRWLVRYQDRT